MKFKTVKIIDSSDWDQLVSDTYEKPYNFQQQDGCKSRGTYEFTVPIKNPEDFEDTEIPEIVNGPEMGVKFESWLARHPKLPLKNQEYDFELDLWWGRNFYPHVEMIIDDLHKRGILSEGEYVINIDR